MFAGTWEPKIRYDVLSYLDKIRDTLYLILPGWDASAVFTRAKFHASSSLARPRTRPCDAIDTAASRVRQHSARDADVCVVTRIRTARRRGPHGLWRLVLRWLRRVGCRVPAGGPRRVPGAVQASEGLLRGDPREAARHRLRGERRRRRRRRLPRRGQQRREGRHDQAWRRASGDDGGDVDRAQVRAQADPVALPRLRHDHGRHRQQRTKVPQEAPQRRHPPGMRPLPSNGIQLHSAAFSCIQLHSICTTAAYSCTLRPPSCLQPPTSTLLPPPSCLRLQLHPAALSCIQLH